MPHAGLFRVLLLGIGIPQLVVSSWALFAPRSFYDDFPGFGREWIPPYGPFNEHFIMDYGSFTLALAVMLVIAAVMLDRRVVQVALVVWIVGALPHFISHLNSTDLLDTGDNIANLAALGGYVVVPLLLLVLSTRGDNANGQDRSRAA